MKTFSQEEIIQEIIKLLKGKTHKEAVRILETTEQELGNKAVLIP